MNLKILFNKYWYIFFFIASAILAAILIIFAPSLLLNYTVECIDGEKKTFSNFEDAYLYQYNCSSINNNYINNDNISFYNGIK